MFCIFIYGSSFKRRNYIRLCFIAVIIAVDILNASMFFFFHKEELYKKYDCPTEDSTSIKIVSCVEFAHYKRGLGIFLLYDRIEVYGRNYFLK